MVFVLELSLWIPGGILALDLGSNAVEGFRDSIIQDECLPGDQTMW